MWFSHCVVSLITLVVPLATKAYEETEMGIGEVSARRHADKLRQKLMQHNYDYDSSESNSLEAHARLNVAKSDILNPNLNKHINKHLFYMANPTSSTARASNTPKYPVSYPSPTPSTVHSTQPTTVTHTFHRTHSAPIHYQQLVHIIQQSLSPASSYPALRVRMTTPNNTPTQPTTYPPTPSPSTPLLNWVKDEIFGDHDLMTPFHKHSTIGDKLRTPRPNHFVVVDTSGKDQQYAFTDVKWLFDQKALVGHQQDIPFEADPFAKPLDQEHNNEIRTRLTNSDVQIQDQNNTSKETMKNIFKPYPSPVGKQETRKLKIMIGKLTTQVNDIDYSMAPMVEETRTSLPKAINAVYIPRSKDSNVIIPAPVDKTETHKRQPVAAKLPEHVISNTDFFYYMDDARLAPPEPKGSKPRFHADTVIDEDDSATITGQKRYKVLKISDPSGRRSHGLASRTFIQEEGADGVAISKVDNEPFPEFRLPSNRRQYMLASDFTDSSKDNEFVQD